MTTSRTMSEQPAAAGWQVLRKTATAELCAEGRLGDGAGEGSASRDLRLERWWVRSAREELLRLSEYDPQGRRARGPLYLSEADLVGMLAVAWDAGVLSDFAKRQLYLLVANRAETVG